MKSLKIAVAHTFISADIRENGEHIRRLIREAADEGCRLIQFPEGAISGYCKQQVKDWARFNWDVMASELDIIADLARELNIWAVVGGAHRLSSTDFPHNCLYVISDQGRLHTRYDKRFISHNELHDWYAPGEEAIIFGVDGVKVGLALCLEIQFPEVFDEYRGLGADCVLLSAYAGEPSRFDLLAQAHAELHNLWIGFSTPVNKIDDDRPLPSSFIGPDGSVVSITKLSEDGLAIGTVAPDDPAWDIPIKRARPWRELARKGDIYRERRVKNDPRSADRNNF